MDNLNHLLFRFPFRARVCFLSKLLKSLGLAPPPLRQEKYSWMINILCSDLPENQTLCIL